MKISIVIIARNEAARIKGCIESVAFADEIIVIDNNSSDKTIEIAKKFRARIVTHNETNFAKLRNAGLKEAKNDWLFYIDADEIVTKELASEIQETINSNQHAAYRVQRQNYYLGKPWPHIEKLERLFRKDSLKEWYGYVHESPKVEGPIGELHGVLLHYTHRNLSEMVAKTIEWSAIEARLRFEAHHPPVVWWRFPRVMCGTFFDFYITQGGWKVGTVGLIESMYQAFSVFITYARLWELQSSFAKASKDKHTI